MTTVCQRPGFVVNLVDTSEPRIRILRIDLESVPVDDDLDATLVMVSTFIKQYDGRLVLHLRHVETPELQPPDMKAMLSIVGGLMDMKEVIDTKLKGTVVQGTQVDDVARVAKNLFVHLYQPKRPFDLVASDAEVAAFLDPILKHEAEKRERRDRH